MRATYASRHRRQITPHEYTLDRKCCARDNDTEPCIAESDIVIDNNVKQILRVDDDEDSLRCQRSHSHYVFSLSTSKRTRPNTCYVAPVIIERAPDVDVRPSWLFVHK